LPLQAPEVTEPKVEPEAGAKPKLEAVDFAPFSYYEGACARCHGENGANYGDLLAKHTDAQLHEGIDMMAKGPGNRLCPSLSSRSW
jgi:mono/diheme cytochrome c family protein